MLLANRGLTLTRIKHYAPEIEMHEGVTVVRDTLEGGTKARYLWQLFIRHDEIVYASSAEGTAQVALAACAKRWDKKAVIYGPARKVLHPRQVEAIKLGADYRPVKPGYMSVCAAKARRHAEARGSYLLPFGAVTPDATDVIADTANTLKVKPDFVWCASGSGTLIKGLVKAWPRAQHHVCQVGHQLTPEEVGGATIHESLFKYGWAAPANFAPFDCDAHYERKGFYALKQWMTQHKPKGKVLFWSVMSSSEIH